MSNFNLKLNTVIKIRDADRRTSVQFIPKKKKENVNSYLSPACGT